MRNQSLGRRDFILQGLASASSLAFAPVLSGQTPAARKLKYGVVGSGNRSRNFHLPMLRDNLPEVEIVALCDITPEALAEGLRVCGGSAVGYSDYSRMLSEHPDLDAVIVVVPNFLHADFTIQALEAGKHVLVEKPMAIHLADANRMREAARQRNLVLQVGLQSRYSTAFHRMAELIAQGAIGDLEVVFGSIFRGDWNPKSWKYTDPKTGKKTNWRFLTYTAGSSLCEDGIHELDVIHWLVGAPPQQIQAQGGNSVFKDRETIDNANLLIQFSNGVRCAFAFTIFTPDVSDSVVKRFFGSQAEMLLEEHGDGQNIVINHYQGKTERVFVPNRTPEEDKVWHGNPNDDDFNIETCREHKAFANSIRTGAPPFADGQVGLDAIHISLAAERSLRTGRIISWQDEETL
jgi:predicted dehydrogenase